jgi:dimethylglycine dehydrogenase
VLCQRGASGAPTSIIDRPRATAGSSGGYMFHVKHSGGFGYVRSDLADASRALEIEILGERKPARIFEQAPYDPDGKRLRM